MNCRGSSHKWPPEHDWSEVSCAFHSWWSRLRYGERKLIQGLSLEGRLMHHIVCQLYGRNSICWILHCTQETQKLQPCLHAYQHSCLGPFRCWNIWTTIKLISRQACNEHNEAELNEATHIKVDGLALETSENNLTLLTNQLTWFSINDFFRVDIFVPMWEVLFGIVMIRAG